MNVRAPIQPALRSLFMQFVQDFTLEVGKLGKDLARTLTFDDVKKAQDKRAEISHPGARGGKWYRDKKGHVKYGERPTERFHEALDEEETHDLHANIQAVMAAGHVPSVIKFLEDHLDADLVAEDDIQNLLEVSDVARVQGVDLKTAFTEGFKEADVEVTDKDGNITGTRKLTDDEINEKWNNMAQGWDKLTKKKGFKEAMQEAIDKLQKEDIQNDAVFTNGKEKTADMVKNITADTGKGGVEKVGLDLFAGGLLHGLYQIGKETGKYQDLAVSNTKVLQALLHKDKLSASQLLLVATAGRREHQNTLGPDGTLSPNPFAFVLFGNKFDLSSDFNKAYEKESGRKLSDAQAKKLHGQMQDAQASLTKMLGTFERGTDGGVLNELVDGTLDAEDVFTSKDLKAKMAEKLANYAALRENAIKAGENTKWESDPAMSKDLKLFPHQAQCLNWMMTAKKGINALDTGLGKTPTCIDFVSKLIASGKGKRGIISMPPSLLVQWPKEIEKFRPGSKVVVLDERMSRQDKIDMVNAINSGKVHADFVLMSSAVVKQYSKDTIRKSTKNKPIMDAATKKPKIDEKTGKPMVRKHLDLDALAANHEHDDLMGPLQRMEGAFMIDEAHTAVSGSRNERNRGAVALKKHMASREYGFLMTATPISKDPGDLHSMMNIVAPEAVGKSKKKWMNKVKVDSFNPLTGKKDGVAYSGFKQMNDDVRPHIFAKRKSDPDVAPHIKLPPKNNHTVSLKFDKAHKDYYDRASKMVVKAAKLAMKSGKAADKLNVLEKINQQRQAAISPELLDPKWKGRTPKIQAFIDIVKKHFADPANHGKPCTGFCSYPKAFPILIRELQKEGFHKSQIGVIDGTVSSEMRGAIQDAANEGKLSIVLLGTESGGAGLNLQKAANKTIFIDKPWSPASLGQADGRVYRTGSKAKQVDAYHLSMENAFDEKIIEKLGNKITIADGVLYAHRGEDAANELTVKNLENLVTDLRSTRTSPEEKRKAREAYKKLGLGEDFPLPADVKKEFDVKKYKNLQKDKKYGDGFGQFADDQLKLAQFRHGAGKLSKEAFAEQTAKIKANKANWHAATGSIPPFMQGKMPMAKNATAKDPQKQWQLSSKNPFEKTHDLSAFYDMVKRSKADNPVDFANTFLKKKLGDEKWDSEPEKGQPSERDKAHAFAKQVFNALAAQKALVPRISTRGNTLADLRAKDKGVNASEVKEPVKQAGPKTKPKAKASKAKTKSIPKKKPTPKGKKK